MYVCRSTTGAGPAGSATVALRSFVPFPCLAGSGEGPPFLFRVIAFFLPRLRRRTHSPRDGKRGFHHHGGPRSSRLRGGGSASSARGGMSWCTSLLGSGSASRADRGGG